MLVNFLSLWSILLPFGIFYGYLVHFVVILVYFVVILVYFVVILVYFVDILVYFSNFGMLYGDKSGNPGF
jgi:hypothetical protein